MKSHFRNALLVTLLLPACAWAASPLDGSWRLDAKRSYWTDGKMPPHMSLTIKVSFDDGRLDYASVNDTNPGKPAHLEYHVPLDGKVRPLPNHGPDDRYNEIAVSQMDSHNFQLLKMKNDDVIVGEFWTFSEDGKHLVRKGVGKSAEGKSKAFVEYFERI